ncbi:hypothetical protein MCEMRE26_01409 [Candidatus Nanopelagicaceae bacterium]
MKLDIKQLFPREVSLFKGFLAVRVITALFLLLVIARSCIHLFAEDGGAQSIAGIDISVVGGDNTIAIFHQWGAIQLLLGALLSLLFFRYPGFTPLVLLTLATDPVLRAIAGAMMPLTTEGTPPGESLNWIAFFLLSILFITSLVEKNPKGRNQSF